VLREPFNISAEETAAGEKNKNPGFDSMGRALTALSAGARARFLSILALGAVTVASLAWLGNSAVDACSRVLWNDNGKAVIVGRNLDWFAPMPADLWTLPRGVARNGMTGKNSLSWTSKYGSLVAAVAVKPQELASTDGMNEKGFAGHLLWLAESDYGERDESRPGLSVALWMQYYLDNFATVKEAVDFTNSTPYQLVTMPIDGKTATVHLALEDPTGDSAIIEFMAGKPRVHHSRDYTVMTNSPPFDQQLAQLKEYKGFGGDKALPGSTEAADRFVRAAYYLKNLPPPQNNRQAVAALLSVMRNVAQPFGAADPTRPNISMTQWRTVADLTNMVYFFESSLSPNIIWVKVKDLNFSKGAPARILDLIRNPDRVGDVTKQFEPAKIFEFPTLASR
jgi:choloylglycine hydrolase